MSKLHRTAAAAIALTGALLSPSVAGINWPREQLLPTFAKPAPTQDLISIPPVGSASPKAEAVLFSSLKGLVNRAKPRIWTCEGPGDAKYEWLTEIGLSYKEPRDPWALITKYRQEIKGIIVYDDAQPDTINLATTIAGSSNALVASPELVAKLTSAPYSLPILKDLRGKFEGRLGVYQYLYDHYWATTTHRVLTGLNPTAVYGNLREYAVAINSTVLWLDPREPKEKALLDRFLASMGPGTLYMGWWAEEGSGVRAASAYGIVTCASDWSTNLTNLGGTSRKVTVKRASAAIPPIENKIYVAFIISDGDNFQYLEHHLHAMWLDPERGKIPMGWTVSPTMLDAMPGLLDYYYKTATANDCLLCGPSGYGYTYPNDWHDGEALNHFVAKSDDYCKRAGLRIITIWNTITGGIDPKVGDAYAKHAPSLLGLTGQNAGGGLKIYDHTLPSFALTATYCGVMDHLVREVKGGSAGWDGKSPRFLIIQAEPWHGLMPTDFVTFVKGLNSNYQIVRPDTLFQMMRSINQLPTDPLKSE